MLKAALAKGGQAQAQPQQPAETKVDTASFPCIDEGQPLSSEDLAQDIDQRLKLHRQASLAGSLPSARGYRNSVSARSAGTRAAAGRCRPQPPPSCLQGPRWQPAGGAAAGTAV